MSALPSLALGDQRIGVTLSAAQAKEVARVLRIQLACEFDRPFEEPLPSREDAGRLRTVLDLCVDQLETLAWGEPSGDVRMAAPCVLLEGIARDLLGGANEKLANPMSWNARDVQTVRRQARQMIRAADTINGALASGLQCRMAS